MSIYDAIAQGGNNRVVEMHIAGQQAAQQQKTAAVNQRHTAAQANLLELSVQEEKRVAEANAWVRKVISTEKDPLAALEQAPAMYRDVARKTRQELVDRSFEEIGLELSAVDTRTKVAGALARGINNAADWERMAPTMAKVLGTEVPKKYDPKFLASIQQSAGMQEKMNTDMGKAYEDLRIAMERNDPDAIATAMETIQHIKKERALALMPDPDSYGVPTPTKTELGLANQFFNSMLSSNPSILSGGGQEIPLADLFEFETSTSDGETTYSVNGFGREVINRVAALAERLKKQYPQLDHDTALRMAWSQTAPYIETSYTYDGWADWGDPDKVVGSLNFSRRDEEEEAPAEEEPAAGVSTGIINRNPKVAAILKDTRFDK